MTLIKYWSHPRYIYFEQCLIKDQLGRRWIIESPKDLVLTKDHIETIKELLMQGKNLEIKKVLGIENGGWWVSCLEKDNPLFVSSDKLRALKYGDLDFEISENGEIK